VSEANNFNSKPKTHHSKQTKAKAPPPLSLYIHIPWCVRKCPYCDFNSHAVDAGLDETAYVDALLADLKIEVAFALGRPLQSIFIGGGTPSLFTPTAIERLLSGVRGQIPWVEDIEITMEANPGAVEAAHFAGYHAAGINRLSLGVQSFQAQSLQALGRIHGPDEALRAVSLARAAGFERINLDLMFGLPGQSREMAAKDLEMAIGLETEHLSYYQLTLEPNTPFHHRPPKLADEDTLWEMQRNGEERLANAGFQHYEVSAFARSGGRCRHNLNYWRFGDYLGIGAGAHGKLTSVDGVIRRRWKLRHPQAYLASLSRGDGLQGQRELLAEDRIVEFMMNALRLLDGVEGDLFEQVTGLELAAIGDAMKRARQRGLLVADRGSIQATPLGLRFLNDLLGYFNVNNDY
jgi:putative oxygen-independent coproporphyrinogen III oxidase